MLEGIGKEYNPFLNIDNAVRGGYKKFLESDGEEKEAVKAVNGKGFVPIEEIPDYYPDPLTILLAKEEGLRVDDQINDQGGSVQEIPVIKTFISLSGVFHAVSEKDYANLPDIV